MQESTKPTNPTNTRNKPTKRKKKKPKKERKSHSAWFHPLTFQLGVYKSDFPILFPDLKKQTWPISLFSFLPLVSPSDIYLHQFLQGGQSYSPPPPPHLYIATPNISRYPVVDTIIWLRKYLTTPWANPRLQVIKWFLVCFDLQYGRLVELCETLKGLD